MNRDRRLRLARYVLAADPVQTPLSLSTAPAGTKDSTKPKGVPDMTHTEIEGKAKEMYDHFQTQGIPLNIQSLTGHKEQVQAELNSILAALQAQYGFLPNPNRPEDYAKIAQSAGHALPTSPNGRTKTDEYTIERAAKDVPALKEMQRARSVRRKVSILTNLINSSKDGRVFPTYSIDPTLGRTHAGGDANPMNWSKDDVQNHVNLPGHQILIADYSRMEPKVLALMSKDTQLQDDLKSDPYISLAKLAFKTNAPTPQQRNQAKIAFLSPIYGNTAAGVAAQLKVHKSVAEKIINAWHKRYPQASAYLEELKGLGRTNGYAQSYHGRQKPLAKGDPDANDRLAVNSVIQNTAGDVARVGFHNVYANQKLKAMGVKFVTTVHDSLIMAVPNTVDLKEVKAIVKSEMVDNNDPNFGLSVEFKSGESWGKAA